MLCNLMKRRIYVNWKFHQVVDERLAIRIDSKTRFWVFFWGGKSKRRNKKEKGAQKYSWTFIEFRTSPFIKVSIKNSVFLKEVSIKVRLKSFANVLIASKGLKTLWQSLAELLGFHDKNNEEESSLVRQCSPQPDIPEVVYLTFWHLVRCLGPRYDLWGRKLEGSLDTIVLR